MKTIVKLPVLTISLFIILIGVFILIYSMGIIDQNTLDFTLKLWPVILIISGAFLFGNSLYNKNHYRTDQIRIKNYKLPAMMTKNELQLKIDFAYGDLWLGMNETEKGYQLNLEQASSLSEPVIKQIEQEGGTLLSIMMEKIIFPSPVFLKNSWNLFCNTDDTLNLEINAHEANTYLDLRFLKIELLSFKGNNGNHEILFGDRQKKLKGTIYSSSSSLSLIFLPDMQIRIKLLNHFCRTNYPQGDFIKQGNGTLSHPGNSNKSVEIIVDGPLKCLNIDFIEI